MGAEFAVELIEVVKTFGAVRAVAGASLGIHKGEFFSILGPSGCGKTTFLRLIAGFERPDRGSIRLGGRPIEDEPPYRRDVNTVFQHYALFPHMTVFDNVAFGLRMKGLPKAEVARRVEEALALVRLPGHGDRRPRQLSGGQMQRVALARALVNRPAVLLLDEPLGALDLKLRREMQVELKALQRRVGTTFLYVTHDQEEALTMSDRLAVMRDGCIEQVGPPVEVYERPQTRFVAEFMGETNLFEGRLERTDGDFRVFRTVEGLILQIAECRVQSADFENPKSEIRNPKCDVEGVALVVRPEKITIGREAPPNGLNTLPGTIEDILYLGTTTKYLIQAGGRTLLVSEQNSGPRPHGGDLRPGDPVVLSWAPESGLLLR